MPKKITASQGIVPVERIEQRILLIRGHKVMLDSHLAELYQVATGNLNLAVRRNIERFPDDFMFQLTKGETENLRLQFATSSSGYGGRRYLPYVFTEQGVAMFSTVLKSGRAIAVNIAIMRTFVRSVRSSQHVRSLLNGSPRWRRRTTSSLKSYSIF
jgi:hypothetical protein